MTWRSTWPVLVPQSTREIRQWVRNWQATQSFCKLPRIPSTDLLNLYTSDSGNSTCAFVILSQSYFFSLQLYYLMGMKTVNFHISLYQKVKMRYLSMFILVVCTANGVFHFLLSSGRIKCIIALWCNELITNCSKFIKTISSPVVTKNTDC